MIEVEKSEDREYLGHYRPSSMHCDREMVFSRLGVAPDDKLDYQNIGMAKTGTHRHSDIQEALWRFADGNGWEYVSAEQWYKDNKDSFPHKLEIIKNDEYETRFYCPELNVSFQCDGILYHLKSKRYFLFEFKNKMSFATKTKVWSDEKNKYIYQDYVGVHDKHLPQISLYGYLLNLDYAIYLCERRDDCYLLVPTVFKITNKLKKEQLDRINSCERHVKDGTFPNIIGDSYYCKHFCSYHKECKNVGY